MQGFGLAATRRRGTVRDAYGLPLATTREAARRYDEALGAVLRVQPGAEAALLAAVEEDPGFAIGHASLALLSHEGLASIPAEPALRRAESIPAPDDRTAGFVAAVGARVREAASAPLLAYIDAYPRDALAVSACVPTIAFAGATEVPEQAWALIEGLAPAYGSDWWYLGMLAFIRQEQHRWADSEVLAERALADEPAGGHAAHARAHVYYETGEHAAGLRWIDGWMSRDGRSSSHLAHYAWHAALHELALRRDTEIRERFRAQLAPPAVTGVRALIDSASLLWRCRLAGTWPGVAIADVLASVPEDLLRRPATGFVAMHAAFALAAADDAEALDGLHRYAAGSPLPVLRDLVAPLACALSAYIGGNYARCCALLEPLDQRCRPLGGSDAQRQIITETLISALIHVGRCEDAERRVMIRTDMSPSVS